MRDICDQLRLHTLAFDLFFHRFLKSGLDLCQFCLEWFKHTNILRDLRVKISLCDTVCRLHQNLVIPLYSVILSFQQIKQPNRVSNQPHDSKHPHTHKCHKDQEIYNHDFQNGFIGFLTEINMSHLFCKTIPLSLYPWENLINQTVFPDIALHPKIPYRIQNQHGAHHDSKNHKQLSAGRQNLPSICIGEPFFRAVREKADLIHIGSAQSKA